MNFKMSSGHDSLDYGARREYDEDDPKFGVPLPTKEVPESCKI